LWDVGREYDSIGKGETMKPEQSLMPLQRVVHLHRLVI
jgi:hypothetical protein